MYSMCWLQQLGIVLNNLFSWFTTIWARGWLMLNEVVMSSNTNEIKSTFGVKDIGID